MSDIGIPDGVQEYGCCAVDDARGSGHDGVCAWVCGKCEGAQKCWLCNGMAGEDDCTSCEGCDGTGDCQYCWDGMEVADA